MATTPVASIVSGADLFFCEPYSCKLLARACVERQARFSAGIDKTGLRLCGNCGIGREVQARSGVVIDPATLVRRGRPPPRASVPAVNPQILAVPLNDPPNAGTVVENASAPAAPAPVCAQHPPDNVVHRDLKPEKTRPVGRGSDFPPTIVAPKSEPPAQAPQPDKPKRDPKALTREKLERGLVLASKQQDPHLEEEVFEEWMEFLDHHGIETLGLALAAFSRLEPRRVGMTYVKHKLGDAQDRAVTFIREHPRRTTSEVAAGLGANYQNMRHTLQALEPRGLIRREHDAIRAAMVWVSVQPEETLLPPASATAPGDTTPRAALGDR